MVKFKQVASEVKLCILHNPDVADSSEFIALSRVKGTAKGKLDYLKKIRDERMLQPLESGVRMENICMRILESIEDIDIETVGYHRKCYQNFTNHLDRLKPIESSNPTASRSPRKERPSNIDLFPDKCIFCNRLAK